MTPCVSREYFGYDVLGSLVVALDSGRNVAGTQLYGPYGNQRYTTGSLPTSLGYAGQRADSVTGLDYDVARYYDPVVGQFLTADTVQGNEQGQDPSASVGGNPETRTDPTGHYYTTLDNSGPIGRIFSSDGGRTMTISTHDPLVDKEPITKTMPRHSNPSKPTRPNLRPNPCGELSVCHGPMRNPGTSYMRQSGLSSTGDSLIAIGKKGLEDVWFHRLVDMLRNWFLPELMICVHRSIGPRF
ncbi:RHS repeat-associated core domain-containing protein [Thermogemmatispora onikobensis]|uniref:RHS repeat-associated core domain-containing protein n=1 Tax=Thermogemmatispora onikobensis TaxID=732234 RepID=UPI00159EF5DA